MRCVLPVAFGAVAGIALFCTSFYVWMVFGADPDKDPLLSF